MKFEEKLQSLRKKSNLSQEALADKLGVSRQAVSKWESGTSYPEMDKLIMMSKIFKCTLDDLVNDNVKDKDVLEREANKKTGYFNTFINSIVKSINMFCSMKMTSVIKCLFELLILGFFLFCVTAVINSILIYIVGCCTSYFDDVICFFVIFFYIIFIIMIILSDIFIFFQFYKTRYLDFYNQVSYSINQASEIEGDIPTDNKRMKLNEKAPKIIIRDSESSQTSIIEVLYDSVISLGKILLSIISAFILLFIIFIVGALCLSIYLMIYNKLFIGVSLCILCVGIVSIYIFTILVRCVINKNNKLMPFIITLIVAICIFSASFTFSFISLKDIDVVDNEYQTKEIKIDYQDDLIISSDIVEYKVVDSEDVIVSIKYIDGLNKYEYEVDNNIHNINVVDLNDNTFKSIDLFIKNLKNNKFIDYSYMSYSIEIKANRKNIEKIIENTSKYRKVEKYEEYSNSIYVEYDRYLHNNSYCNLNKAGFYNCYDVYNESTCDVEVVNGSIMVDSSKCHCTSGINYDYLCYNNIK